MTIKPDTSTIKADKPPKDPNIHGLEVVLGLEFGSAPRPHFETRISRSLKMIGQKKRYLHMA